MHTLGLTVTSGAILDWTATLCKTNLSCSVCFQCPWQPCCQHFRYHTYFHATHCAESCPGRCVQEQISNYTRDLLHAQLNLTGSCYHTGETEWRYSAVCDVHFYQCCSIGLCYHFGLPCYFTSQELHKKSIKPSMKDQLELIHKVQSVLFVSHDLRMLIIKLLTKMKGLASCTLFVMICTQLNSLFIVILF